MLEPIALNHKLVGQYILFLEYPDGTVAIMYEGRKINYTVFNKLARLQKNAVVENKRSRLKKSMPSRKAQKAIIEQRNLNPVFDSFN